MYVASMTMQVGDARRPSWLMLWWWRRAAHRREIELAAVDLHERYGPAAYVIARNTAHGGTAEYRRFWRQVARQLKRLMRTSRF